MLRTRLVRKADEEAETQLRIWDLLEDRSDNVERDMRSERTNAGRLLRMERTRLEIVVMGWSDLGLEEES